MADGKLIFDTKIDSSGFDKGLSGLGKISKAGFSLMKNTVLAAGAAVAGFSAYSIKAGGDFQAAMSEVAAISGASGDSLVALEAKAKEMGASTVFSATESAEALKYMAMAGWQDQQMLEGLEGVMNLAAASGENLGLVADIVTDSLTAFGLEAGDSAKFADVLAAAATSSNTNVGILGESFKYVAPLAGAMGYSVEDVSVALGLMANAGIKGSQAGTSLRSALTRLANPTGDAAKKLDALGVSITDAHGEMKPLNQLLPELRESFKDLSEEQQIQAASSIFGREAMAGMLAIINASDEDFDSLTESINNSAGAAEEMSKIMIDNLQGDITLLKSAVEGLGISFFEHMDSGLRNVVQAATGYIGILQDAIEKDGISGAVAAFGEIVADIAVKIAEAAPQMIQAAVGLIQSFISGISENKDLIIASITEATTALLEAAMEIIPEMLALGMDIVVGLITGITDNLDTLMPAAVDMIFTIVDTLIDNLDILIPAAIEIIITVMQAMIDNLDKIIDAGMHLIETLAGAIIDNLPTIIESGIQLVLNLISGILRKLPDIIETGISLVGGLARAIIGSLPQVLAAGVQLVLQLVIGIIQTIPQALKSALDLAGAVIGGIKDGLSSAFSIGANLVTGLWNGIASVKDWIIGKIGGFTSSVVSSMKSFFGIRSPSTVFRDEVGKNLALGIGVGFEAETDSLNKDMKDAMAGIVQDWETAVQVGSSSMVGGSEIVHKSEIVHSGVIRIEGVNSSGEFIDAADVLMDRLMLEVRGY